MFRIRRIYDDLLPVNRAAVLQVQEILRAQFPALTEKDIDKLPEQLRNPLKYRFRSILYVAENQRGQIQGFALLLHAPDLHFCYLEYISAAEKMTGRGIGGALYERVREEALALGTIGIFFECLPDDPALCRDPEILRRTGPGCDSTSDTAPGRSPAPPTRRRSSRGTTIRPTWSSTISAQGVRSRPRAGAGHRPGHPGAQVRPSLPAGYIDMVVDSFRDDPVRLRPPRYIEAGDRRRRCRARSSPSTGRSPWSSTTSTTSTMSASAATWSRRCASARSCARLERTGLFPPGAGAPFFRKAHPGGARRRFRRLPEDGLRQICQGRNRSTPTSFPIRNAARPPKDLAVRAGYYCIDTFTPLNRNA